MRKKRIPWLLIALVLPVLLVGTVLASLSQSKLEGGVPPTQNPEDPKVYLPAIYNIYPPPGFPGVAPDLYVDHPLTLTDVSADVGTIVWQTPGMQDQAIALLYGTPGCLDRDTIGPYMPLGAGFIKPDDVISTSIAFARSWYGNTRSDFDSQLTLIIAVNNYMPDYAGLESACGADFAHRFGRMWGDVVNRVISGTVIYRPQVRVVIGGDFEVGWATFDQTKAMIEGIIETSNCTPSGHEGGCLFNIASAGGCPQTYGNFGGCNDGWTLGNVYGYAQGMKRVGDSFSFVKPFPMFYANHGENNYQWVNVSFWGTQNGQFYLWFLGSTTQNARCQAAKSAECKVTDYPPTTAWCKLRDLLLSHRELVQFAPRWASDVVRQAEYFLFKPETPPCQ